MDMTKFCFLIQRGRSIYNGWVNICVYVCIYHRDVNNNLPMKVPYL